MYILILCIKSGDLMYSVFWASLGVYLWAFLSSADLLRIMSPDFLRKVKKHLNLFCYRWYRVFGSMRSTEETSGGVIAYVIEFHAYTLFWVQMQPMGLRADGTNWTALKAHHHGVPQCFCKCSIITEPIEQKRPSELRFWRWLTGPITS